MPFLSWWWVRLCIAIVVIILLALVIAALGGAEWALQIGHFHWNVGVTKS